MITLKKSESLLSRCYEIFEIVASLSTSTRVRNKSIMEYLHIPTEVDYGGWFFRTQRRVTVDDVVRPSIVSRHSVQSNRRGWCG